MIDFINISIKEVYDYDKLRNVLPECLIDDYVLNHLKKFIGNRCESIVIEYPYYDRDYLSSYYSHYSKKFRTYEKKCARIHFEGEDDYYGYITLRPTLDNTKFGKTYLSPQLLIKKDAYLMLGERCAHVYGYEYSFKAFPWKRQQTDISCCAHTAVWTIIRYFSNKHKGYADATIGEIARKVKNESGRKTPTQGLSPTQVSDLFKDFGFSPLVIYNRREGGGIKENSFLDEIFTYVESGIPMVGFITPEKHAVSIIGHGRVNYNLLDDKDYINQCIDTTANVISSTRLIESLYVMDDGEFPYREVTKALPSKASDVKYGLNQFTYAVIPLYAKMQLTYHDVYNRMLQWICGKVMNWKKQNVCRIYITSSNSLKRNAMESETMPEILQDLIARISLPKFVWCIDLAGIENYKMQLTSGRIIVDATSATVDKEPWILRHDGNRIQYRDYDENPDYIYSIDVSIAPYDFYINNLDCVEIGD